MKACLILLVGYMLMASYVAKEQRNLGFWGFIGTIVGGAIIRRFEKKQNKLIAVGDNDVQVS